MTYLASALNMNWTLSRGPRLLLDSNGGANSCAFENGFEGGSKESVRLLSIGFEGEGPEAWLGMLIQRKKRNKCYVSF